MWYIPESLVLSILRAAHDDAGHWAKLGGFLVAGSLKSCLGLAKNLFHLRFQTTHLPSWIPRNRPHPRLAQARLPCGRLPQQG